MANLTIDGGAMLCDGLPFLTGLNGAVQVTPASEFGYFLHFSAGVPASSHTVSLGKIEGVARWSACHRYEPFWMSTKAGEAAGDIPAETQFLILERSNGSSVILVPLIDGPFRCALQGASNGTVELVSETGDTRTTGSAFTGLFVAAGSNPYDLVRKGAHAVASIFGPKCLRQNKPMPSWLDTFGWCTWDSFYQDVTHDKVRLGLESFSQGGVAPKLLILDDGWQSVNKAVTGEDRLSGFPANEKFPGGLTATVRMAKDEFGIANFLVWHAMTGYWGGVDPNSFPSYSVPIGTRTLSPGILRHISELPYWGKTVGVVAPGDIGRFFDDYHASLQSQGVDGVKVDTQATLETVAEGLGGRVSLMRHYREALETSVLAHFNGSLINCMSCANEMLYGALNSTVTRTSTDFWPDKPESHGLHLYVNSQVSLWFGEFIQPDWDMFQSAHAAGPYHAAGRVVGGGSIYVSDKPDKHNFDLLKKLVLSDGSILRADAPGRPTRDCLFHDCTREDVLLKIFNTYGQTGIVGAFNAQSAAETSVSGTVCPSDVDGICGETFAVYAQTTGELRLMTRQDCWNITLPPLGFELFTIVPVMDGFAAIGHPEMYLSAGTISQRSTDDEIGLKTGGKFLAWRQQSPSTVEAAGTSVEFTYDLATGRLEVDVPGGSPTILKFT